MHLTQHELCTSKTELALDKFYLDSHPVTRPWRQTLTIRKWRQSRISADQRKWRQIRISVVSPRTRFAANSPEGRSGQRPRDPAPAPTGARPSAAAKVRWSRSPFLTGNPNRIHIILQILRHALTYCSQRVAYRVDVLSYAESWRLILQWLLVEVW